MAADIEALVTTLKADISSFEREMKKAGVIAAQEARNIGDSVDRASDNVRRAFGKMLGGLVGGAGVTAFAEWLRSSITQLADLQRQALMTATAVEALAGIQFAAGNSGVDKDKALKETAELARNVYKEIQDGEGEITKLFEANGLKLTERNGNMRELKDILADVGGLVANANNAFDAQQILKTVGLSNEWLGIMRRGSDAVRELIDEGERLNDGLGETARKAAEFEQRWSEAWASFSAGSREAILTAMNLLSGLADLAESIFKGIAAQAAKIPAIARMAEREANERAMANVPLQGRSIGLRAFARDNGDPNQTEGAGLPPERPRGILTRRGGTKIPKDDDEGGGKGGKAAKEKQNEFDREEKNMQRRIRTLGAEAEAVGKSVFEGAKAEAQFRLLEAAKQANVPVTDELRKKVEAIATAYANAKVKLEEAQLAQKNWTQAWEFGGTQLVGILKSATQGMDGLKKAGERLLDTLLEASLQAMILGRGPLAGLFGMATIGSSPGGLIGGLMGMFGGGGGAAAAAIPAGMGSTTVMPAWFDQGGRAGQSLKRMSVPASAFAHAPHFAAGGAMPAMIHPGEIILNAAQQRNVAGKFGGNGGVTVNNYGQTDLVDIRRTVDGGTVVEIARNIAGSMIESNNRKLPGIMAERRMRGGGS